MKKLNAIDKQNLDGVYGATAVALDWPENLSEKAKKALDYLDDTATCSITLESTSSPTKASGLRNLGTEPWTAHSVFPESN